MGGDGGEQGPNCVDLSLEPDGQTFEDGVERQREHGQEVSEAARALVEVRVAAGMVVRRDRGYVDGGERLDVDGAAIRIVAVVVGLGSRSGRRVLVERTVVRLSVAVSEKGTFFFVLAPVPNSDDSAVVVVVLSGTDAVRQLLDEVDEEEAAAEAQFGGWYSVEVVARAFEALPNLRQHVDEAGGHQDTAAEAQQQ